MTTPQIILAIVIALVVLYMATKKSSTVPVPNKLKIAGHRQVRFTAVGIESPTQYRTYSKLVKKGENVINQLNDTGYYSITILKD